MRRSDSMTNSVAMNLSKLQETVEDRGVWCTVVRGVTKSQAELATEEQQYYYHLCHRLIDHMNVALFS